MEIIKPLPKTKKRKGRKPNHSEDYYLQMAKEVASGRLTLRSAGLKYKCSHGTVSHWTNLFRKGLLVERVVRQNEDYSQSGGPDGTRTHDLWPSTTTTVPQVPEFAVSPTSLHVIGRIFRHVSKRERG